MDNIFKSEKCMNNRYTYSIVIPHFNSPESLKRMLGSIPERDDIQIIVVDDGSTDDVKEKISVLTHKNLTIEYLPENHGGGYARNVGFSKVEGKWFIGCDADDFFSEGAFDVLDRYKNYDIDYLCYCIKILDEKKLQEKNESCAANDSVQSYISKQNRKTLNYFKYKNFEPWNKMISVDFMKKNKIIWENCRVNIDVLFGLQIGLFGKNFIAIPDVLYNIVHVANSIVRKKRSIEREFQFYLQVQKRNTIYRALNLGYPFFRPDFLYIPFMIKKRGVCDAIRFFAYWGKNFNRVKAARKEYSFLLNYIRPYNLKKA